MRMPLLAVLATVTAAANPLPPAQERRPDLTVIATTDVHGNFFPYNFITRTPWGGSLARVCAFVDSVREELGDERVILLDNGDILQGQPSVYYYNYVDTTRQHIVPRIFRSMGYDAATVGNHDIETGHAVYDRWIEASHPVPVLGANVVESDSGLPYLKPYIVIEREGMRVAVLGLLTPAIPAWLPENLWNGLRFEDMEESAGKWISHIRATEHPDLIIGLFHSGGDSSQTASGFNENAALEVARRVDGFDAVIFGHDHRPYNSRLLNDAGREVVVLNPAANASAVAQVDVMFDRNDDGEIIGCSLAGAIQRIDKIEPSPRFMREFADDYATIREFVDRRLGESTGLFTSREAFHGPCAFMDLLHRLQLRITGADISFAAPLSADSRIHPGEVTMSDMFTLYKYENMLCVVNLSGAEVKSYLEMSYDGWKRTLEHRNDPELSTPVYNLDSAAGIIYEVDLSKPYGERVAILSMSDGVPFDMEKNYTVAMNSYRACGGGNLLIDGAGLSRPELKERVVWSTDRDMRYYLIDLITKEGKIEPTVARNWKFVD